MMHHPFIERLAYQRPTPSAPRLPVPRWHDLPGHAQRDLQRAGFSQGSPELVDDQTRLTVLVLYVKLAGTQLWQFIKRDPLHPSELGKLQFQGRPEVGLKALLLPRSDFTDPEPSMSQWSCREKRHLGSLHFKRWPSCRLHARCGGYIEAHIDYYGLIMSNSVWCFPPAQLLQMAAHGTSQDSFEDVHRLRALLIEQGWDPATLLGARGPR